MYTLTKKEMTALRQRVTEARPKEREVREALTMTKLKEWITREKYILGIYKRRIKIGEKVFKTKHKARFGK